MTGYAIPDIPRIYTALAEWLSCMVIVLSLKPNIKNPRFAIYAASYLALLVIFMELTANVVLWLWIPCMLMAFMAICAFIWLGILLKKRIASRKVKPIIADGPVPETEENQQ